MACGSLMTQNIQLNLKAPVLGGGEALVPGSSLLSIWLAGLYSSSVLWMQEGREPPRTREGSPCNEERSRGKAVGRGGARNKRTRACLREQVRMPSSPLSLQSCKARDLLDLKEPGPAGGRGSGEAQTRRGGRTAGEGEDPGVGWKDGRISSSGSKEGRQPACVS